MEQGEVQFQDFLKRAVEVNASDLHLKTGLPPVVRVGEELRLVSRKLAAVTAEEMKRIADEIIPPAIRERYHRGREIDLAYHVPSLGRFRLNVHRYRGNLGIVARFIPLEIRSLEQLGMPETLRRIALQPRGLVLITGSTGSGKSTTMAAMLNEWNQTRGGHIITIEDPIESVLLDKKSIVTQREVGLDTDDFASGLRNALRQDPDVIMIGELRDRATIQTALMAAETGHLVLSTLHTKDAIETVSRIIGVFEPEEQREIRMLFANSLTAIISQRLLPTATAAREKGAGSVVPALEILVNTPRIRDLLMEPEKLSMVRSSIEQGFEAYGMQSFDQHLMVLLRQGLISKETAVRYSSNPTDFELKLRGIDSSDQGRWAASARVPGAARHTGAPTLDPTAEAGKGLELEGAPNTTQKPKK